ncbi:hypothetical protein ABH994_007476 [Bradyrhizobium yuanmingense]|uniref:hypothetical protein n=1 Tax=Bradyrhizobium yuanmingense TaxID=108015 RepID=UPI003511C303
MTNDDHERHIADAARIIDQYAFGKNPNEAMMRRQQIATRKATDILGPPHATIAELVGELAVAHKQITDMLAISSTLSSSFQNELGPGIERRAELLARHGRTPDDRRL